MAKIEMRVIPEPAAGTRCVLTAEWSGSRVYKGGDGALTFLCGNCRDVLVKSGDPDDPIIGGIDDTGEPYTLHRVRDVVYRCKGCGAFNEPVVPHPS